jgi:hypothetical protein
MNLDLSCILPMRSAQLELAGVISAIGLPRFVISIPSGPRLSNNDKQFVLKLEMLMVCIVGSV